MKTKPPASHSATSTTSQALQDWTRRRARFAGVLGLVFGVGITLWVISWISPMMGPTWQQWLSVPIIAWVGWKQMERLTQAFARVYARLVPRPPTEDEVKAAQEGRSAEN